MTQVGKTLVFVNLFFSLFLAAWAFGAYVNRIDWSANPAKAPTDPQRPYDAVPPGELWTRIERLKTRWSALPPADGDWRLAQKALVSLEDGVPNNMTSRKDAIKLARTPRYVSRETGAAELEISPETWDRWVKEGRLPPPAPGSSPTAPRWRWQDVDDRMRGTSATDADPFVAAVAKLRHGPKKNQRHYAS